MPGQTLRTVRRVAESLFEVRTALKTLCLKTPYAVQALKTIRSAAERHKTPHAVQARKTDKGGCQGFLTSFSGCTAPSVISIGHGTNVVPASFRVRIPCPRVLFLFRWLLVLSLVAVVVVGVVVVVWLLSPLNHERQTRKDTATITGHCHHHQHHHRRNTGGANKYTSNLSR